jgi:membrane protein DedA with SNARE-associated domain
MLSFLSSLIESLLNIINSLGYLGIFIGMTIESSFFPFPSEIIVIPAGALIARGEMSLLFVFLSALAGSLVGAWINYFLAFFLGRKVIDGLVKKYGSFFLLNEKKLDKTDRYFAKHGEVTTFVGRLIVGIRQLISIPAGFAKMNFLKFSFYTSLGAGIWILVLIAIGYFFGSDISSELKWLLTLILLVLGLLIAIFYIYRKRKKLTKTIKNK